MPDETTLKQQIIKWGALLLVAMFGGLAREAKDRRDGREFDWWNFLSRLVIAAFAGLLVVFLAREYDLSQYWTGLLCGVAGYSGVEAIECVKRFAQARTGQ